MEFPDKLDRRLLSELDRNSRTSYAALAGRLHIAQETARYRVQRLVERGVIKKFFTIVDSSKLGFAFYKVLLKLHSSTEELMQKNIGFLETMRKSLSWIVRLDGLYDIGFVAKVENVMALSALLDDVNDAFGKYVTRRSISINVQGEYLTRTYLSSVVRKPLKPRRYSAQEASYRLDPINRAIVTLLTVDSRITAAAVSRSLAEGGIPVTISPEAIQLRIKRLETEGVILGYNLVLENQLLAQLHYKVLVYTHPSSPENLAAFEDYCRKEPRVVYLIKAIGEWDYELDLEVSGVEHYRSIMAEMMKRCPATIRDYTGLIVSRVYHYNLFPE